MKVSLKVELDVTPGTLKTEEEVKAAAKQALEGPVSQLGFSFGEESFIVNSFTID